MVPLGKNTAASLPSSAETRSHNCQTLGSEPPCSSPTSASSMACFIPGVGFDCVSEYRLIRTGTEKSKRFGAWLMVRSLRRSAATHNTEDLPLLDNLGSLPQCCTMASLTDYTSYADAQQHF